MHYCLAVCSLNIGVIRRHILSDLVKSMHGREKETYSGGDAATASARRLPSHQQLVYVICTLYLYDEFLTCSELTQ